MAQIVYYFYAHFRWQEDAAARGDRFDDVKVNFVVPTGNFGNALAGFYAREMGLPVHKLVIATNHNDILCVTLAAVATRSLRCSCLLLFRLC